jgi:anti-sigma regulatory factor (Ser/Thr protein kinase)
VTLIVLPCEATAARVARRWVRHELQGGGDPPSTVTDTVADTVELLLTEVVTNAVVHASSGSTVRLRLGPERVCVEVKDRSASPLRLAAEPAEPTGPGVPAPGDDLASTAQGGRGLQLLESLAQQWGWRKVAGGKVVWFCVAHEPAA